MTTHNANNIQVGQTVYIRAISSYHRERNRTEPPLEPHEVVRVGRKYFYIKQYSQEVKFSFQWMDDRGEYSARNQAYLTADGRKLEIELRSLYENVKGLLGTTNNGRWTKSQLVEVMRILEETAV